MRLIYFFLFFLPSTFANAQKLELNEILQKKIKNYRSEGLGKSQGLKFSITYPASYSLEDINNANVVKGFSSPRQDLMYIVGINKMEQKITKSESANMLSRQNMELTISLVNSSSKFISYRGNFQLSGLDAAYVDFNTTIEGMNSYSRMYFIIHDNYFVSINFYVFLDEKTLSVDKQRINDYQELFDKISATFKIDAAKFSELSIIEKVKEIKQDIIPTDKNVNNSQWLSNIYRNTKYKFRVSFPDNWEYDNGTSKSTLARALNREKAAVISVLVTVNKNYQESIGEIDSSSYYKYFQEIASLQNTIPKNFKIEKGTLNNFPAQIIQFTSQQSSGTKSYAYLSKQIHCRIGYNLYVISLNLPVSDWSEDMSVTFDRVIESFKFEIVY